MGRSLAKQGRKRPRENINRRSFSKTAQRVAKVRQPKVKLGNLQTRCWMLWLTDDNQICYHIANG
jgi:hypothetical protein